MIVSTLDEHDEAFQHVSLSYKRSDTQLKRETNMYMNTTTRKEREEFTTG